jgi:hypothetical protein
MAREELLNSAEYWQEMAENECYREGIECKIHLIDSNNQWRKAEEFPPEDPKHKGWSVKVIVINDGQHDIGFYDFKHKLWVVAGCINPYFIHISHWQTFPELPKEECYNIKDTK